MRLQRWYLDWELLPTQAELIGTLTSGKLHPIEKYILVGAPENAASVDEVFKKYNAANYPGATRMRAFAVGDVLVDASANRGWRCVNSRGPFDPQWSELTREQVNAFIAHAKSSDVLTLADWQGNITGPEADPKLQ